MRRLLFLFTLLVAMHASAQSPVTVDVDLAHTQGVYKPIYSWFGYDEANNTTTPHGRELLTELHDLTPAPVFIRVHHLLTSGEGVSELKWSSTNVFSIGPDGKPRYDFTLLDGIFDAYKQAGVHPMIEFGFMPKDLTTRPDPYYVKFPANTKGGANDPPKDYAMWGELLRKVTEHLVQRYGKQEALSWYWEIWNEPNGSYWHATAEDYYKLYDYGVAGVRAALPGALVGGPATTGPSVEKAGAYLDAFFQHVVSGKSAVDGKRVPIDFISFHAKGRAEAVDGHLEMNSKKELLDASEGFRILKKYPSISKLPIIMSEADPEGCAACSAEIKQVAEYRNGTVYPAHVALSLKGFFELQDRFQVNLLSMVTWSFEFENSTPFDGYRALSTNGIDKPVLNVFRMAGLMSGQRVAAHSTGAVSLDGILSSGVKQTSDVDAFATADTHGAAIMLWNYFDRDTPAAPASIEVNIHNLPATAKRVLVEQYRIDDHHSNAYTVWLAMGSPKQPTEAQFAALKAAGQLQLFDSPQWIDVNGGKLLLKTELPRQAVALLRIHW